ncbi:DUF2142 domain-containing protein [Vagococcus fluvialis]|uniref:DUF2142 domain-containing protein n=1 Tax=Vagococcus fluvialis TaxID=2738 RepID=UPI0037D1EDCE
MNYQDIFNERVFNRKKYYGLLFLFLTIVLLGEKNFVGLPKKAILFLSVITFLIIFLWGKSIEKNTLIIGLTFGLTFAFLSPVFDVWDEPAHFTRVEYISSGNLVLTNDKEKHVVSKDQKILEEKTKFLSKKSDALPNLFKLKLWTYKHNPETEYNYQVPVTNAYGTIGYLPGVAGYTVGKVLSGGNLGVMFYLGRVFNALFYALCAFLAVRLAGKWKHVFTFFSLQPVILYSAGSYNQDAFGYGIMLIVVALFFKMIQNKDEEINYKELGIYFVLCAVLAFTKLPYIVLAGLPFFIPFKKYKDKKMYAVMLGGIVSIILISLMWFMLYSRIEGLEPTAKNVDVGRQIQYIINNFTEFLGTLFTSLFITITKYGQLSSYGWDRKGSDVLAIINLIFIGIVFVFPMKDLEKVSKWTKFGVVFLSVLTSILIYLSMYLTWTSVGRGYISGVQGRYFVGLLLLTPLILNYTKVIGKIEEHQYTKYVPQVMAFVLLIWSIASRIGIYY